MQIKFATNIKIIFILLLSFNCLAQENDIMPGFDGLIENRSQNAQPENNDRIIIRRGGKVIRQELNNIGWQTITCIVATLFIFHQGKIFLQKKANPKSGSVIFFSLLAIIFKKNLATLLEHPEGRVGMSLVLTTVFYKDVLKAILSEKTFNFYYDKITKWVV